MYGHFNLHALKKYHAVSYSAWPALIIVLASSGWIHRRAPHTIRWYFTLQSEERLATAVARSFFISPFDVSIIALNAGIVKLRVGK